MCCSDACSAAHAQHSAAPEICSIRRQPTNVAVAALADDCDLIEEQADGHGDGNVGADARSVSVVVSWA